MGKRKVTWTAAGWYRTKKDAKRTADGVRARGYYARTSQRAGGGYDVKTLYLYDIVLQEVKNMIDWGQ